MRRHLEMSRQANRRTRTMDSQQMTSAQRREYNRILANADSVGMALGREPRSTQH